MTTIFQPIIDNWSKFHNNNNPLPINQENNIKLKQLGQGSTGEVFLAETEYGDTFAMKTAPKTQDGQSLREKELLHEIEFLEKLDHPNIIKILGKNIDSDENEIQMNLEYLPFGDLASYIEKHQDVLDLFTIKKLILQIIDALSYLESKNISHHDIKLENIGIDANFNAKLLDFAYAYDYSKTPDHRIRFFGGSIIFSAPEVLEKMAHTSSCDIFSLGVCLFYLLYHCYPFCTSQSSVQNLKANLRNNSLIFPDSATQAERDLLSKMLCIYRRRRILLHQIPAHPFFQ